MRIAPRCLIVILSWTFITNLPSFGEGIGEQPGEVVSEQTSQSCEEGSQGSEHGDQERNSPITQPTAPVTDGLQISVEVTDTQHPDAVVFLVSIKNVGDEDRLLNLGSMLGNGKVLMPAIGLTITDSAGASRELQFSDKRHPGVAGRVDDYILPLRSGSVYTLRLSLENYWCPDTREFSIELTPGTYTVRATFTGNGAKSVNSDTGGLTLLHFWMGHLESPAVRFQIVDLDRS